MSVNHPPQVKLLAREPHRVSLEATLSPDLPCFAGHFPGHPILPGVIMMHWVMCWAQEYLAIQQPAQQLEAIKYQKIVQPGMSIQIELHYQADKHKLTFAVTHAGVPCSSGRIALTGAV